MKSLFDPPVYEEVKARLSRLGLDSPRQWGTMSAAQALAHCAAGLETAVGDKPLPRVFIGRLLGPLVKRLALGSEKPMVRNSPTAPGLLVKDPRDLEAERRRLAALIERFVVGGAAGCTTHPHAFFGALTPDEWARLMYKHLDHHLRQFSV